MSAVTSRDKRAGRPKKLDFDEIVDAALAVLDADGIDAVSFRRLGSELGVSHMTLYTYFDAKEDLLNAMVGRALALPDLERGPGRRWDTQLLEAMKQVHAALVARPGIAQLLVTHTFDGAWVGELRARLLGLLEPAGLGKQKTVDGISVLFNFLLGTVMVETSRGLGGSSASVDFGLELLIDGLRRTANQQRRKP
jgi:TetR/AcrR family transcriptional regulator, tetracycline repressor protein